MFQGRKLLIATRHQKEKVIAPVLERALGVNCFIDPQLDTDSLGTFTGEILRKDTPLVAARNKCLMAMEYNNCDLAVASEGSFGPHPAMYAIPCNQELLLFMDKKNKLEINVNVLSVETNFDGREITTEEELRAFAQKINFPTHGLIIKNSQHDFSDIVKGITSEQHLKRTFREFLLSYGKAFVETDMRAIYNPTRMKVIKKAALKLAAKINSRCPQCNFPGFGITASKLGLPCELCKVPTPGILSRIAVCEQCAYTKEEIYPNGKRFESPMYCPVCNP